MLDHKMGFARIRECALKCGLNGDHDNDDLVVNAVCEAIMMADVDKKDVITKADADAKAAVAKEANDLLRDDILVHKGEIGELEDKLAVAMADIADLKLRLGIAPDAESDDADPALTGQDDGSDSTENTEASTPSVN